MSASFEQIPATLQKNLAELAAAAQLHRSAPFKSFHERRFAGIPDDVRRAEEMQRHEIGRYQPHYEQAFNRAHHAGQELSRADIEQYMSPYQHHVINRIADEGMRTLRERLLPTLESKFSHLGQHGSLQHRKEAQRFTREMMQDISDRQNEAMHRGYEHALGTAKGEKERGLTSANMLAALNAMRHAGSQSDIQGLMHQGRTQQQMEQLVRDFAYQEYLRQQAYPMEQLAAESAILRGLPYSTAQVVYPQTQFAHQLAGQRQEHLNWLGQLGSIAGQLSGAGRMTGRF